MDLVVGFGLIGLVIVLSALVAGLVDRGPISFPIIFLGLGMALGGGASGLVEVGLDSPVLELVATLTLALVLFLDALDLESGSRKDWLVPALVLGPGTLFVVTIVAVAGAVLFDLPWHLAVLLGAVLASTDAVVLRDVVQDSRVPRPVRRILSVEAGTNDIIILPTVLVLVALSTRRTGIGGPGDWALLGFQILVVGPVVGFAVGAAGSWALALADARFAVRREYQALYGVGLVLAAYAAAVGLGGDGFLAAFFAGAAVPILDRALCDCFLEFGEAATEVLMLLAFVMFGALLSEELQMVPLLPGLALAALTILVARPLAIGSLLSLRAASLSRPARAFIAWFGPRGLNSLLFALLVVQAGVPRSEFLLALAGLVVTVSVLAHGTTATPVSGWYARRVARETLEEERVGTASALFTHTADEVERVSPRQLEDMRRHGQPPAVVVDVRSRSSFERDRVQIPGSVRVLPDSVREWAADQLRNQPYVLYCT